MDGAVYLQPQPRLSLTGLRLQHASLFLSLMTQKPVTIDGVRVGAALDELRAILVGRSLTITPELGRQAADLLQRLALQVLQQDAQEDASCSAL